MQCGAVNEAGASVCCFCDARLSNSKRQDIAVSTQLRPVDHPRVEGNLATAPDWQNEISHRLEAYRAKRGKLRGDSAQPEFSFERVNVVEDERHYYVQAAVPQAQAADAAPLMMAAAPAAAPAMQTRQPRPRGEDRFEIDVSQPSFDFAGTSQFARASRPASQSRDGAFLQVAALSKRQNAGALDAAVLLFAFGGFWSLFKALGGNFTFSSFSAMVIGATLALLYAQYFSLFTYFGGATPGMMVCGLCVVSFEGSEPNSQQLLWRSFGYLISAGTMTLGFFWALWDEDHLTWQDRISQTYITPVLNEDVRYAARQQPGRR